jgi:hypothetical protein
MAGNGLVSDETAGIAPVFSIFIIDLASTANPKSMLAKGQPEVEVFS